MAWQCVSVHLYFWLYAVFIPIGSYLVLICFVDIMHACRYNACMDVTLIYYESLYYYSTSVI